MLRLASPVLSSSVCTDLNRPAARPDACDPAVSRSTTTTDRPAIAQCSAVLRPSAPAPITTTSAFMTSVCLQNGPMDPKHAILFEPVRIGPRTLPTRFYQVPHASGFGSGRPRARAAFRAIKADGGWGGVCVEYAAVTCDSDEIPEISADFWDERDAAALALTAQAVRAHGALAGIELFQGGAQGGRRGLRHRVRV